MDNSTISVFNKIDRKDRVNWHLYIDAIYKADPSKKNFSAEVLSKLLGVKNQGGFRYLGKTEKPNLIVLWSTGDDDYWRDEIDNTLGLFLYYGDNKRPGYDLHDTELNGNEILKNVFNLAVSDDLEDRKKIPPILVFKRTNGWDVKFLGLAVPGIKGKPAKDWLTAVWGTNKDNDRFQNYKAFFTILDTSTGCKAESGQGISLQWLNDIEKGNAYESDYAPLTWKKYIYNSMYSPLISRTERSKKNKKEQLPDEKNKIEMLNCLHSFFIDKDRGYSFEQFAAYLVECMDNDIESIDVTRPYKDGGFDAIGKYKIFKTAGNSIYVDFYLQAKCYSSNNAVTVKDTSRLISRIKNRQFGIMITTSYVADQAYQEILDDNHPIVIINGKNIIDYIYNEMELRSVEALSKWLNKNYNLGKE